ncbi:MAG: hypothetical protein COW59_13280 [Lysobacterales bacterium CG17_big_fil_post_rev_8_21_14_2_50_64_11]|nr:MAG: hypothetical protein COW59_13280 [Xanthomonadales bacterium CG17_big_fil_post_rev_8_21_14_2_50_64_11]PIX61006.1 MAG: hypothetical protein COZ47_04285 [Xanthomonadales bacterium CG_4_10_14_3_um_filter_64_11]
MTQSPLPARVATRRYSWLFKLLLLAVLLATVHFAGGWLMHWLDGYLGASFARWGDWALLVWFIVYMLALATPFVPGVEISFAIMLLLGGKGIAAMYLATLAGLSLSYAVGRRVPLSALAAMLAWLRLRRAGALVQTLAQVPRERQLDYLLQVAPVRVIPFLLRHRYLALALAFNLPGNALLGGGGGIALLAGLSGQFRYPYYVLMVCLAIAPVPVLLLLTGWQPI